MSVSKEFVSSFLKKEGGREKWLSESKGNITARLLVPTGSFQVVDRVAEHVREQILDRLLPLCLQTFPQQRLHARTMHVRALGHDALRASDDDVARLLNHLMLRDRA
mmetsp:Transcript_29822/g.95389  ORF Transcript_29822/g.95389 Transcript_29822/m.95389 type:complete len:107 (+) Transcript_29822:938-1258(+)